MNENDYRAIADALLYTHRHRIAIRFLIEKFKDRITPDEYRALTARAKIHDLDKSTMRLLGMDLDAASDLHRKTSAHHLENGQPKTGVDLIEAILDYESAGYTKPDKPRNAYDTIRELKPDEMPRLTPYLDKLGIRSSYKNTPEDLQWREYLDRIPAPTIETAIDEILDFVRINPGMLAYLGRQHAIEMANILKNLDGNRS